MQELCSFFVETPCPRFIQSQSLLVGTALRLPPTGLGLCLENVKQQQVGTFPEILTPREGPTLPAYTETSGHNHHVETLQLFGLNPRHELTVFLEKISLFKPPPLE